MIGERSLTMANISMKQDVVRWFLWIEPQWRDIGETVNGGPIIEQGWYVDPYCHPMFCRPEGPFPTEGAARKWARDEADRIKVEDNEQA